MIRASMAAGNALFLAFVIYLLCLIFGVFGVKTYIATQTANAQISDMGVRYLRICTVLSIGLIFFSVFEKTLQATGLSLYSTIAQVSGALVNIILDPILIYGLFGLPVMGVDGAAYATVIGQLVSAIAGFVFHIKLNKDLQNGIRYIRPSLKIIKQIYAIGLPAIIAQALMSVMTYGLNIILVRIDEAMVTAYGLYYKIQQFILFAAFGLRDAITPVVSFNHGMRNKTRVKQSMRYGIIYTLVIMAAGLIVIEIFAHPFSLFFGLSGATQNLCVSAMRIISISFIFAGINIAYQGIYQALDSGIESLVISLCHQIIFVLPVAWGFSLIAMNLPSGGWLVWLTFPIAEFISALIGSLFMKRISKNKIDVMN